MEYLKESTRINEDDSHIKQVVTEILDDVRTNGEDAVRRYSLKFDKWDPPSFRVSQEEIHRALKSLSRILLEDIELALSHIRAFAQRQREQFEDFEENVRPGVWLGQRVIPIGRAGSYTPGGRYPLIVSALMTIGTARVAGVKEVIAMGPPSGGDGINPATLSAMFLAGAEEIYCIGGVQALASMAYGALADLEPVDFIAGAGNAFVAEAKRQLFGTVGVDLLAGPTEILVIADETADPSIVAADLLGQAEHDPRSEAVLVSTSRRLAEEVLEKVEQLLRDWPTKEIAEVAWRENGQIVVADSREESVAISDSIGPEHLEVQTDDLDWYVDNLRNYGSIFLGEEATVVYSDKCIGTNHVLPTRRAARYTGGLSVSKFLKIVTTHRLNRRGSTDTAGLAGRLSAAEKMLGHEITARLRTEKYASENAHG
ncbi:MAG: histidinol dehydrogenase [Actinobacteria bacterium]|nr:histidinol dehydrogenase [Actinomycetota bacterium]